MVSSWLLYCCSQEDGVTSPRSEEGQGRAGPGLLLWQALSKQCECCPSGFASLEKAGCSLCLGLAQQMLLLDLHYQCRVGLLCFTQSGQLCMCGSVCCVPCSGVGGVEEDGALCWLARL